VQLTQDRAIKKKSYVFTARGRSRRNPAQQFNIAYDPYSKLNEVRSEVAFQALQMQLVETDQCCARAASGHAAALPSAAMNARRFDHLIGGDEQLVVHSEAKRHGSLSVDDKSNLVAFNTGRSAGLASPCGRREYPKDNMKLLL